MFLKITTKKYRSKIYRHASLAETIRIKGKVVQKHIKNLGVLNTVEDKKKGKQQIVIGLLLAEGLPFAHKVWKGNTPDKTTLHDAVTQAKELGVTNFVFVADRGLITDKNILWLEDQKLEYIIATKRRNDNLIRSLMEKDISEKVTKVHEESNRVYYLCYNEEVAKEQMNVLNDIKTRIEEKINSIKNPTEHKILEAAGKAKRLFTFSFKNK